MEEIWKEAVYLNNDGQLITFDGWYEVSNFGRVRSYRDRGGSRVKDKRRTIPIMLKPRRQKNGYYLVQMKLSGQTRSNLYLLHRIVCSTFLELPHNISKVKIQVNHKDENKENNIVTNLEWCTPKDNTNYGTRTKRAAQSGSKTKNTQEWKSNHIGANATGSRAVIGINIQTNEVVSFDSMMCAERFLGIPLSSRSISATIRGKQKTAYGFKWYYKEDYENITKSS